MEAPLFRTGKSIITQKYSLFLNTSRYIPHIDQLQCLNDKQYIKVIYRRFFRLKPFISQRLMVRETYRNYIRYKFRKEDYAFKRTLVINSPVNISERDQMINTLTFVLKAVSFMEGENCPEMVDNLFCRKILKNILTLEYYKERLEWRSPGNLAEIRKNFKYLSSKEPELKWTSLMHVDRLLIYLNETLGTRL